MAENEPKDTKEALEKSRESIRGLGKLKPATNQGTGQHQDQKSGDK